jgi:hypothetical protein
MRARRESRFLLILPKVVYIGLTLGGGIFIWIAKTKGWSAPFTIGVPASLIAFYFALSWLLGGLRVHDEQAGDNLYYMGFLFTLVSLGAALYRFNANESVEAIVRDFGLAVVTTICGIGFRVFYNQVRRDPIEIERTARHELADMTRRVRGEMEAASQEFARFRRVSNQMLQEGFEEIGRQAERSGQQIIKTLESLTIEAVKPIRDAGEQIKTTFAEVGDRAETRLATAADRLEGLTLAISTFAENVEAAGAKLAEVKTPDEVITLRLRPTLKTLEKLIAAQTQSLEAGQAETGRQLGALEQTQAAVHRLAAVLEQSVAANGQALQAIERSRQAAEALGEQIERHYAEIRKYVERAERSTAAPVRPAVSPIAPPPIRDPSVVAGPRPDPPRPQVKPTSGVPVDTQNVPRPGERRSWWTRR